MHEIGNIHTFEDSTFLQSICRASYAVLLAGTLGGAVLFLCGIPCELPAVITGGVCNVALLLAGIVVATLASFALHECVHALFFKVLGPVGSRVTFGWNLDVAMIYACAEGSVYSRRRYLVIVLAPTVMVTGIIVASGVLSGCTFASWVVCVLHLSGCTGDWFYARTIVSDPRIRWCEDEAWGVRFYGEEKDEGNDCE